MKTSYVELEAKYKILEMNAEENEALRKEVESTKAKLAEVLYSFYSNVTNK